MSVTRYVQLQLHCDHPGCDEVRLGDPEESGRAVRRDARKQGWRYRPGHPAVPQQAADFCPTHAEEAK